MSSDTKATGHHRVTLDPMSFESVASSNTSTITEVQGQRMKMLMLMKFETTMRR